MLFMNGLKSVAFKYVYSRRDAVSDSAVVNTNIFFITQLSLLCVTVIRLKIRPSQNWHF